MGGSRQQRRQRGSKQTLSAAVPRRTGRMIPKRKIDRTSAALMRSCGFLTSRRLMKFLALPLIDDHASWWNW